MGDMGDIFRDMKEAKKERKEKRLKNADDTGWSKHTTYHWYRETPRGRLSYWPSTGLCMLNGKRHNIRGKYIKNLLEKLNAADELAATKIYEGL